MLLSSPNELVKAVEKLKLKHNSSDTSNYVSISLGVGTLENKEKLEAKGLIERADQALYKSKEMGRNQVTLASAL